MKPLPINLAVTEMKPLPINLAVAENDRGETTTFNGIPGAFDVYHGSGDQSDIIIVTEQGKPKNIFMVARREVWLRIFPDEK